MHDTPAPLLLRKPWVPRVPLVRARCGKQNLGLRCEEREEGQREMTVKKGRRRKNEIKQ
jgi:hypothetical protein